MSRWFRLYDDAINDPKILKLPEALRWSWVALLCIASKNNGALPPTDDVALMLRTTPAKAAAIITALVQATLLDRVGSGYAPHNWNGRQFKSDVSTERVQRFRNGKRNVSETASETAPDTEQIQNRSEQTKTAPSADQPAVEKKSRRKPQTPLPDPFDIAAQTVAAAIKLGFTQPEIEREHRKFKNNATEKDRRAADWIAAERNWFENAAVYAGKSPVDAIDQKLADDGNIEVLDDEALLAWDAYRMAKEGRNFPRNKRGGWRFPTQWPPGYVSHETKHDPPEIKLQSMSS